MRLPMRQPLINERVAAIEVRGLTLKPDVGLEPKSVT